VLPFHQLHQTLDLGEDPDQNNKCKGIAVLLTVT
jgi:hypothetical protein